MTTDISKLAVGDQVWFYKYSSLASGFIRLIKEQKSGYDCKKLVCIETTDSLEVVQVDGGDRANIWITPWEPKLKKAKEIQTQAGSLLQEAARLFSDSGTEQQKESETKEAPKVQE